MRTLLALLGLLLLIAPAHAQQPNGHTLGGSEQFPLINGTGAFTSATAQDIANFVGNSGTVPANANLSTNPVTAAGPQTNSLSIWTSYLNGTSNPNAVVFGGAASLNGGGNLTGTFTGSPVFSGNPTFSGTVNLTGALSPASIATSGAANLTGGGALAGSFSGNPTFSGAPVLSTGSVTATGGTTALTTAALAAQQGVLLDAFKVAGDADDTASFTRAVTAQVPILCGPRTYSVNDFSTGAVSTFILKGVPGCVIQRNSAPSGSQFFQISATKVYIDNVTFDMNKANVTANQWGVFLGSGGQNITIQNSTLKNNSGSLGSCLTLQSTGPGAGGAFIVRNNEITGCTFNPLYFASVSNGDVDGNYIHDNSAGAGAYVLANGSASSTNYSSNIILRGNRFIANTGPGLSMGSFAPPYAYANPAAQQITVANNIFQDNSTYQLGFDNTTNVSVIGNKFIQSSSGVTTRGGIDCNTSKFLIADNDLSFPSASYGIDCGGAVEGVIRNNNVNMGNGGTAIDVGGAVNSQVTNNHLSLTGTGVAVSVYDIETDASLNPFPNHASNIAIQNNDIILSGTTASGVQTYDDAGATSGALPIIVQGNRFVGVSSAASSQDVNYFSAGSGIVVSGNTHNGAPGVAVVLNGSTDYVFETVYDYVQGDTTAGSVRAIVNGYVNTYNAGTKILYVTVSAGGSGYTAATTLAPSGGCTWAGSPLIVSGVILGVRTTATGASCSGATTIAATDAGGGSGATFTVSVTPALPARKNIQYKASAAMVVQLSGGAIGISGTPGPLITPNGDLFGLTANSIGSQWILAVPPPVAPFTVSGLPTCNSSYNKTTALVTDAASPTYNGALTGSGTSLVPVTCNGTSWTSH